LSEDSPISRSFAITQRVKTLEKLNQEKQKQDYFFSVLFSAEEDFRHQFRKQILELLEKARTKIEKSKSERVYQLNIDFFNWG